MATKKKKDPPPLTDSLSLSLINASSPTAATAAEGEEVPRDLWRVAKIVAS